MLHQAQVLADWNLFKSKGHGLGKQAAVNQRVAQWKVAGKAFKGGVYANIFSASNFQESSNGSDMMTWTCLCAVHGEKAMLAVCIGSVCVFVDEV